MGLPLGGFMSPRQEWILNAVLFSMMALIFLTGLYQNPTYLEGWHLFNYFWFMATTFLGVAAMGLVLWKAGRPPSFDFRDPWLWAAVAVFLPAALLRLSYTWDISIWLDEYVQVANTITPFKESAVQQQPPFYYLLSTAIVDLIGWTEAWLRSPSLVFGSGCILLGAFLGRLLGFGKGVFLSWLLFLAFTPILVRYSFEGRPNITGVFVCLLWICSIVPVFNNGSFTKSDGIRVFLGTYIFCLTIGLQSLALPLYSIPFLLAAGFLLKDFKTYKKIAGVQGLALLVFSPILYGIVFESIAYNQFQTDWGARLLGLQDFQWVDFGMRVLRMVPFFEFLLGGGLLALILLGRKRKKGAVVAALLFGAAVLLPFVFSAIFQVTINWLFYDRYFLCYVVVFLITTLWILSRVEVLVPKWQPGALLFVSVAFLTGVAGAFKLQAETNISGIYNYGSDFRSMFEYVNNNSGRSNLIAQFTALSEGTYEPRTLVAPEFYLERREGAEYHYRRFSEAELREGDQVLGIVKSLFENEFTDVFLVMGPFSHLDDQRFPALKGFSNIHHETKEDYDLLHFQSGEETIRVQIRKFFEVWLDSEPEMDHLFKIREFLFYMDYFSGNLESARKGYQEIEAVAGQLEPSYLRSTKILIMQEYLAKGGRE